MARGCAHKQWDRIVGKSPDGDCSIALQRSAEYQPQRSAAADAARLAAVIERCGRPSTGGHAGPSSHALAASRAGPVEAHPLIVVRLLWNTESELAREMSRDIS